MSARPSRPGPRGPRPAAWLGLWLAAPALLLASSCSGGTSVPPGDAGDAGATANEPAAGARHPDPVADAADPATAGGAAEAAPAAPAAALPPPYTNPTGTVALQCGIFLVARDPATGDLGVACLSTAPASGPVVAAARAGVGAVALAGRVDSAWHGKVLDRLAAGQAPAQVVADLSSDEFRARTRALAVLDAGGHGAAFAGGGVTPVADFVAGEDHLALCVQAIRPDAAKLVSDAFVAAQGVPLPERLWLALDAVHQPSLLNGKVRSGSILVVRKDGAPDGSSDRFVDVRVDYDEDPHRALGTLLDVVYRAYVGPRLRELQKGFSDTSDPMYRANLSWLRRIQQCVEIGAPSK